MSGVETASKPKVWAKARVGLDVLCWHRGEPNPRPAKITRIDQETGKAYLYVFHDGIRGVVIATEAPHKSQYVPETRTTCWDFNA